MEIKSRKKNSKTILLEVNGMEYEIKAKKRIMRKNFIYLLSKESLERAIEFCKVLLERRMADSVNIDKHMDSGVYYIYKYKDWKNNK